MGNYHIQTFDLVDNLVFRSYRGATTEYPEMITLSSRSGADVTPVEESPETTVPDAETSEDNSTLVETLVSVPAVDYVGQHFPVFFSWGFAITTLLIIFTYGCFKAFSLVRLKSS